MILDQPNHKKPHPTHRWFFVAAMIMLLIGGLFYFFAKPNLTETFSSVNFEIVIILPFLIFTSILLFFATLYFIFYQNLKTPLNPKWSKLHFFATITILPIALPQFAFLCFMFYSGVNPLVAAGLIQYFFIGSIFILLIYSQFIFLKNIFRSIFHSFSAK